MTTKIETIWHRCNICGIKYTCPAEAQHCEVRGISLPRFVAGDVIRLLPTEAQALGLSNPDVLVDIREFVGHGGPTHSFAFAGRGIRYHVRAQGGQKMIVEAVAVTVDMNDYVYCPDWDTFLRRASTGRPNDMEGLEGVRSMLNQKLDLGL